MKRLVVLSSLLVVLAAIIAGCGGGGTKTVTVTLARRIDHGFIRSLGTGGRNRNRRRIGSR